MSQAQGKLVPAFRFEAQVAAPLDVGTTPTSGARAFLEVLSSKLSGSDFDGEGVGSAGDWATVGPDGYGQLNVRMHAKDKSTGELLYLTYYGHLEMTEGVQKVLGKAPDAKDLAFDSYNHRVAMAIETSGKKFAWVNRTIFVGKGSFKFDASKKESTVIYDIFRFE